MRINCLYLNKGAPYKNKKNQLQGTINKINQSYNNETKNPDTNY